MAFTAFLVFITLECSIILFYLSMRVYRRKTILGQKYFWIILFLLSLICLLLGVENLGTVFPGLAPYTDSWIVFSLLNFCGHLITTIWILFCLFYTGKTRFLTKPVVAFLLGYTILGDLAYQLNRYSSVEFGEYFGVPLLDSIIQVFGVSSPISCLLFFLAGILLLILQYKYVSEQFRHQIIILVAGACLATISVTIYEGRIFPSFNPVGVHFAITGLIFGFGMLYYDLLTYSPVFRERFFGVVGSGLIVLNKKHQILDMNASAERILHLPLADAFGKRPDEIPLPAQGIRDLLAHPDLPADSPPLFVDEGGEMRWFRVSVQRDIQHIGIEPVYLYVFTDISDQILLEKEVARANAELIREREKKRREILYRMHFFGHRDAILILSNGHIIDTNPVALDLFQKSRDEIIGMDPSLLSAETRYSQDDVPDKLKYHVAEAAGGKQIDFFWVFSAGEKEIPAEVRLNRLVYEDEVLVEMDIRDISHVWAGEELLRSEHEALKAVLANDILLWNQVSQMIRRDHALSDVSEFEEIVRRAMSNLRQVQDNTIGESGKDQVS